ncbi:MAG TPA: hypothetical protein VGS12_00260 [Caulobacteraceae bacterium]|nr:hypothetical protein [Caulobacteraceae bacterium]
MAFHAEWGERGRTAARNHAQKERRVKEGRAHAALVFEGARCVGRCQFGRPAELPRIKSRRAYEEGLKALPDWRITCFFVDRARRRQGVAHAALEGAIAEVARLGGGQVEAYPEDVADRKLPGAFLYTGSLALFERHGFSRQRQIGKNRWVVSRTVAARP